MSAIEWKGYVFVMDDSVKPQCYECRRELRIDDIDKIYYNTSSSFTGDRCEFYCNECDDSYIVYGKILEIPERMRNDISSYQTLLSSFIQSIKDRGWIVEFDYNRTIVRNEHGEEIGYY